MGQSFPCFCTVPRGCRTEEAVQFHIFLTSRVFEVERSTIRFCFFTPLYPNDSKLGASHYWYRFNGDGSSICWYQESTFSPSQRRQKFYWFSSRWAKAENIWKHSCNVCYSMFLWHRRDIFWSFSKESMMSFRRKTFVPKNYSTFTLYSQDRSTILVCNVGTPDPTTNHHDSYDYNVTATNSFSQQILTDRSSKNVNVGTLMANLCFL